MRLTLHVWRQSGPDQAGRFETFQATDVSEHMSFLEMLDVVNEGITLEGGEPIAFEHDCREGICGSCGMVVNGRPHGPQKLTTACQLHMRLYKDGDELWIEPWRATAFPVIKDLVVDRSAFDRIIQAGGYISVRTGSAPDGNATPIPKLHADEAFDAATCIGCGACVAACPNASAMLFTGAKVSHLGLSGHHGGMQDVLNAAIDDGRYEVLFTKYDFASYPDQDEILGRAKTKGIGTLVFKTGAGNREKEIKDLEAGGLSYKQATIKWALTNPNVASVCVKITNFSQIRDYAEAASTKMTEPEVAMLRTYTEQMYDKYCRFCSTCEASCPHEVAVADVMRYAMYFKYYGREKDSMEQYGKLPGECTAASCDGCSAPCDSACPFGRQVQKELVEAHRLLSFARA